jgi:hypothetical protein
MEDNMVYENFLTLTEDIFKQVKFSGYSILAKPNNIFECASPSSNSRRVYPEANVEIILEQLKNHLYKNENFYLTGDFGWKIKEEWIKGFSNFNPTKEHVQKIYESCFQTLDFETMTHCIPKEQSHILLWIMESRQYPIEDTTNQSLYKISGLKNGLTNVLKNWKNVFSEEELFQSLYKLLGNFTSTLSNPIKNEHDKKIAQEIFETLKYICPNKVLEFLPLFKILPQKTDVVENMFELKENAIIQIKVNRQRMFNQYELITKVINIINDFQPGNIKTIDFNPIKSGMVGYTKLLVESQDLNLPDIKLCTQLIEDLCTIYYNDKEENQFNEDFWKKAIHNVYLNATLSDKNAVVILIMNL